MHGSRRSFDRGKGAAVVALALALTAAPALAAPPAGPDSGFARFAGLWHHLVDPLVSVFAEIGQGADPDGPTARFYEPLGSGADPDGTPSPLRDRVGHGACAEGAPSALFERLGSGADPDGAPSSAPQPSGPDARTSFPAFERPTG